MGFFSVFPLARNAWTGPFFCAFGNKSVSTLVSAPDNSPNSEIKLARTIEGLTAWPGWLEKKKREKVVFVSELQSTHDLGSWQILWNIF